MSEKREPVDGPWSRLFAEWLAFDMDLENDKTDSVEQLPTDVRAILHMHSEIANACAKVMNSLRRSEPIDLATYRGVERHGRWHLEAAKAILGPLPFNSELT